MTTFSIFAARDGDTYLDSVEADNQADAETKARKQLAVAWNMVDLLEAWIREDHESGFDAELDGFLVTPAPAVLPAELAPCFDLGELMSVIGWAEQFAEDWMEMADSESTRKDGADACALVERVKAATLACQAAKPIRVLIALDGGLVQGGCSDVPVEIIVVDYDTGGADPAELVDVPQDDGTTTEAFAHSQSFTVDPAFIDGAEAAMIAHDKEGIDDVG